MPVVSTCYISRMLRRSVALGLALASACCSKSEVKSGSGGGDTPIPASPTFTMFALAEVRGQIGPCGCTSDPARGHRRGRPSSWRTPGPAARCSWSTPGPCSTRRTRCRRSSTPRRSSRPTCSRTSTRSSSRSPRSGSAPQTSRRGRQRAPPAAVGREPGAGRRGSRERREGLGSPAARRSACSA